MKRTKVLDIILLIMKILLPLILLVPLVFFSFNVVRSRMSDIANLEDDAYHSGTGLVVFLQGFLLMIINAATFVLTGICLLIAHRFRSSQKRERHFRHFAWLMFAPFVNMLLYVWAVMIALTVG